MLRVLALRGLQAIEAIVPLQQLAVLGGVSTSCIHTSAATRDEGLGKEGQPPDHAEEYVEPEHSSDGMLMEDRTFSSTPRLDLVELYMSESHFNAREKFKMKKQEIIKEMQAFEHDTGSYPVQIGLISERIAELTKHCITHKKDHHSRRGLLVLLSRRRKQLKYLRRQNFEQYVQVINKYNLKDNYYASGWGEVYRVGTNLKWKPTAADVEGKVSGLSEDFNEKLYKEKARLKANAAKRKAEENSIRLQIIQNRKNKVWSAVNKRLESIPEHLRNPGP